MEFFTESLRPVIRKPNFDEFREPKLDELKSTIHQAQEYLLKFQKADCLWDFPAYLGPHLTSHYMLFMNWIGRTTTPVDQKYLRELLLERQLPDGSWYQCKDLNLSSGDINITIFNYWGLKIMGEPIDAPHMRRAREFILSQGGLSKAMIFTKIVLALYRNISWEEIPYTPYIVFSDKMIMNYKSFSQWVIPHIFAIGYMRRLRISKDFGPLYDLSELNRDTDRKPILPPLRPLKTIDGYVIKKMLKHQQPKGTWGGYTVATLFSVASLSHYNSFHTDLEKQTKPAIKKALDFLDKLYFECGEGSYLGHAMDSHYWDTILAGLALVESGYDKEKIKKIADYIFNASNPENGGIPFGFDFEYAPDVDDTSEAVLFCAALGAARTDDLKKATQWLISMQSNDGGYGAFDKNNNGNILLRFATKNLSDSAALFDYSSADSTGNVLEALASMGYNKTNSETVRRGIKFLKKAQTEDGSWFGRWAINHIFGTCCALIGLMTASEDPSEDYIKRACNWLLSCQNTDGGWGESTKSYNDPHWIGKGISTPTQTAWALMSLIECGYASHPAVRLGVRYLIDDFKKNGKWEDSCVVGTGHPGLIYLEYPSYPLTFPLIALGKYAKHMQARQNN